MTDYSGLQKRCQRGATNLNDANNLLAECYAALGVLSADLNKARWIGEESASLGERRREAIQVLQKEANRYQHIKSTWHDGGLILRLHADVLPEDWDAAIDADMGNGG